jgi:hypothetical protein
MIEKVANDLTNLYQQRLIEFNKTINQMAPNEPLFEIDQHDVNHRDYQQLTVDAMTFVDQSNGNNLRFTTWLPLSIKQNFHDAEAFPQADNGDYLAKEISVKYGHGLVVAGDDRWFSWIPPFWEDAKSIMTNDFCLKGEDAALFWQICWQLHVTFKAEIFVLGIKRDPSLLSHIREEEPYLLDHPSIQQQIVEAFRDNRITEPKSVCGQKLQITQNIFDLYHWVYWYRHQGQTLEKACMYAVDFQSELVPEDWADPYETLKKRVIRLDKYPRISQLQGFRDRKT